MNQQPKSAVGNAGDPEQVAKAAKADLRRLAIADEDLRYVLKTENGRRVIQNIIDRCCINEEIWQPSAAIHYLAGKQAIGFALKRAIEEACPDLWIVMEKERLEHMDLLKIEKPQTDLNEEE